MADSKVRCNYCSKLFLDQKSLDSHKNSEHSGEWKTDGDIERLAKDSIYEVLKSDGNDKGLRERARIGQSFLATQARREQSKSAQEATLVMMAREMAGNKEEFKRYVQVALPHSPLTRLLPVPK